MSKILVAVRRESLDPKFGYSDKPRNIPSGSKSGSKGLILVDYSDKAFAVFGETFPHKDKLLSLGGRFNRFLNYNGTKAPGFIFSIKHYDKVKEFVSTINE